MFLFCKLQGKKKKSSSYSGKSKSREFSINLLTCQNMLKTWRRVWDKHFLIWWFSGTFWAGRDVGKQEAKRCGWPLFFFYFYVQPNSFLSVKSICLPDWTAILLNNIQSVVMNRKFNSKQLSGKHLRWSRNCNSEKSQGCHETGKLHGVKEKFYRKVEYYLAMLYGTTMLTIKLNLF